MNYPRVAGGLVLGAAGAVLARAGLRRAAGLRGDFRDLLIGGPPWRMRAAVRLDDHADGPDGTRVYDNRTVLYITLRWGRVIRQEDFFADTTRIETFEQHLRLAETSR